MHVGLSQPQLSRIVARLEGELAAMGQPRGDAGWQGEVKRTSAVYETWRVSRSVTLATLTTV